jgi:hypothetical protein
MHSLDSRGREGCGDASLPRISPPRVDRGAAPGAYPCDEMLHRRVAPMGAVILVALATGALAQTRRPTPHEALDVATAPVRAALDALNPSESERRAVNDLLQQSEAAAADLVAAEHRRMPDVAAARRRRLEFLARSVHARVEALRAEAAAELAERRALEAEERRRVARGAQERAGERRLAASRGEPVSTWRLPPPAVTADGGVSP